MTQQILIFFFACVYKYIKQFQVSLGNEHSATLTSTSESVLVLLLTSFPRLLFKKMNKKSQNDVISQPTKVLETILIIRFF